MITKGAVLSIFILAYVFPAQTAAQSVWMNLLPVPDSNDSASDSSPNIAKLDLIIESDTYVPYFYQGRREPTPGNKIRLMAVTPSGLSPASFSWQIGSERLISNVPTIETTYPFVAGEILVSVSALDERGRTIGRASEYVRASTPRLSLYEKNNLRGVSRLAITDKFNLSSSEITVRAEPYFFGINSVRRDTQGSWSLLQGQLDILTSSDWRDVTLVKKPDSTDTEATVSLTVSNLLNLREQTSRNFKLGL